MINIWLGSIHERDKKVAMKGYSYATRLIRLMIKTSKTRFHKLPAEETSYKSKMRTILPATRFEFSI